MYTYGLGVIFRDEQTESFNPLGAGVFSHLPLNHMGRGGGGVFWPPVWLPNYRLNEVAGESFYSAPMTCVSYVAAGC